MMTIAPLSGWMLDQIVRLDSLKAGFAGYMLRASAERRQVVAAFLAAVELDDDAAIEAAEFLTEGGHRAILHLAYNAVPAGFRSALRKSGTQPFDAEYYPRLFRMLTGDRAHVINAILQSNRMSPERLTIIGNLPPDLCDSRIIDKLKDAAHSADLVLAVELLERRKLCRTAIVDALRRSDKINETIKRWSLRMPFPPGPIPHCAGYTPIIDGAQLHAIALKYRNCVRGYLTATMSGDHAFGELRVGDQDVLISYDRTNGMWIAEGVYSRSNLTVHVEVSRAAFGFAGRHGVPDRQAGNRTDAAVEALRRMSRFYADWDM